MNTSKAKTWTNTRQASFYQAPRKSAPGCHTKEFAMTPLSAYELEQYEKIEGWKAERPNLLPGFLEKLTAPLARLVESVLSRQAMKEAIDNAYQVSEVFAHQDKIKERAGVAHVHELWAKDLASCDRLAEQCIREAGEQALFRSTTGAGAGGLNITLLVSYSLKTIHTVGFCYGFGLDEPHERDYALAVLQIAAADSLEEKQHAVTTLESVADLIVEEALEHLAEEAIIEAIAERGGLLTLPAVGIVAGAIHDAALMQFVGDVARFSFQERWLRKQGKVTRIQPVAALARPARQRVHDGLAAHVYWACFAASFLIVYPPLLLASLVPTDNALGHGLANGRDVARQDVGQLRTWLSTKLRALTQPAPVPVPATV